MDDPDYVTLASVVASHGLSTSARSGTGELSATGGSSSLTVRADSRRPSSMACDIGSPIRCDRLKGASPFRGWT